MPLGREKKLIHSAGGFNAGAVFRVRGGSAIETAKSVPVLFAALLRLQSTPIVAQRTVFRRGTSVRGYHFYVTAAGALTAAMYDAALTRTATGPRVLAPADIQRWFLATVWVQAFSAASFQVGLNQNLGTATSLAAPFAYVIPALADALYVGAEDAAATLPGTQLEIGQLVLSSGGLMLTTDLADLYAETQRAARIPDLPGESLRIDFGEYRGKKFSTLDGTTVAQQNFGELDRGARVETFLYDSPIAYAHPGDDLVNNWVTA